MSKEIQLVLRADSGSKKIRFDVKGVVCAGFAGRNQEVVRRHIEELARTGVPAPATTPVAYRVEAGLLTNASRISVKGDRTSGEVECVVLFGRERSLVTVGSDHTDRLLERSDIQKSKEVCPKVIAREAWSYDEVMAHWDSLVFRSEVLDDGRMVPYQEGKLADIMPLDQLAEAVGAHGPGTVLFCGTVATKGGQMLYSSRFRMVLEDPVRRRRIEHTYEVAV